MREKQSIHKSNINIFQPCKYIMKTSIQVCKYYMSALTRSNTLFINDLNKNCIENFQEIQITKVIKGKRLLEVNVI